ncbi:MAG: HEPN domain-containing protein [Defluviitaleaceae bacterium]|nr:HEPN domain-containing protein [Defluviitaleaceae bacterium]
MDKSVAMEWIAFSKMDLGAAKYLCNMHPKPLEIICYHCQQSAEKILKAFLVYSNAIPEKTHDLELLRDNCEAFDSSFEDLYDECNRLNPYSIQPRYPFGLELTEQLMTMAIKDSEIINAFVTEKMIEGVKNATK